MLTYELEYSRTEPLYLQIYEHIRKDMESGYIKSGEKLPSKRELASQLGVSIVTVENAYHQLEAEGYIKAVSKKGWFAEKISISQKEREIPRQEYRETEEIKNPPENILFPFSVWAKIMREILVSDQTRLMTRVPCEGAYELRSAIAEHLRNFRNMQVKPEQIIIGAGTEYLYMLLHLLLGESVFGVEEPGYSKISDIYTGLGLQCIRIPMQTDGIDLNTLQNSETEIMHISPSHHFPTGTVTSIGKRYALLGWASEQDNRYIIEDDYDSEFRLSGKPIPSLFSLDVMDKVIYINTFSKTLTPTIRISYMILPSSLLGKFRQKLSRYACTVSNFEQYALAEFIKKGCFEKHLHRMRKYYKDRRNQLFSDMKLYKIFDSSVIMNENVGLHCLVKFQTELSDEALLKEVRKSGFQASALCEYYHEKPEQNLHILLFYY